VLLERRGLQWRPVDVDAGDEEEVLTTTSIWVLVAAVGWVEAVWVEEVALAVEDAVRLDEAFVDGAAALEKDEDAAEPEPRPEEDEPEELNAFGPGAGKDLKLSSQMLGNVTLS
jgi:hypothetical protein